MGGVSTASTGLHVLLILGCSVHPDGTPSRCLRRRVAAALARSRSLGEVWFVAIGGAHPGRPSEAGVIERLLREAGVAPDAIRASPRGLNTIASLRDCLPLLSAARATGRPVTFHVCTDAYHQRRCRVILRLWGIRTLKTPAPPTDLSPSQLLELRWRDRAALIADVPLALLWRAARRLGF
jgi:hypothetical protein